MKGENMKEDLKEILDRHRKWIYGEPEGVRANLSDAYLRGADLRGADLSRANLSDADLRGADLSRANLSDADLSRADLSRAYLSDAYLSRADLSGANLTRADLTRANLSEADLRGADLTRANLTRANLSDAYLRGANLTRANLTGAYLSGANLSGANLSGAYLTRANLSGTCLDPRLLQLQRQFCRECPPLATGGRIVYRTATSRHIGDMSYEPGRTYTAPVLSFDAATACHPGIYAGSLRWMREYYPGIPLVKCYVRDGDWVISAKGAIRCTKLRVLACAGLE